LRPGAPEETRTKAVHESSLFPVAPWFFPVRPHPGVWDVPGYSGLFPGKMKIFDSGKIPSPWSPTPGTPASAGYFNRLFHGRLAGFSEKWPNSY
jgi:hypothetical protein